ncbi:MAG: uncharacterized protein V7637_4339 [Mycobacteriales bacterium]
MTGGTVLVLAKAPVPGQVKTRLCPPCTPAQAAEVAAACLADTVTAVRACGAGRRVLALAGSPAPGSPAPGSLAPGSLAPGSAACGPAPDSLTADSPAAGGFRVVPQRGAGLGERIAAAFADAARLGPTGGGIVQIGMDTPQITPDLLDHCLATLAAPAVDAVLGPAEDGGWWTMGLRDPAAAALVAAVPMSTSDTGRLTERALRGAGLRVALLPVLRDIDHWADALAVAAAAPAGRLAAAVAATDARPATTDARPAAAGAAR